MLITLAHPNSPMTMAQMMERTGRTRQVYDAVKALERSGVLRRQLVDTGIWIWSTVYTDAPEAEVKPEKPKAKKAPKPPVEKPVSPQQHPAVVAYTSVVNRRPSNVVAQQIIDAVTDVPKWEQTVKSYVLRGWNPLNVLGMLKMYRGEITNTPASGRKGAPTITHSAPDKAMQDWERYLAQNDGGEE